MNQLVNSLVTQKSILITGGAGGVGKTTAAAALGTIAALETDRKVLVLTVDPAKRLADAMGLAKFGNVVTKVDLSGFGERSPKGELYAAMLDTKASWDDLVIRYAPNMRVRGEILANPIYRNISSRFVQSHDYIAMESLYDLYNKGDFDLLIVDTPPSRNAMDFLDAPERMADFFSSKLLRWITAPYRSRLVATAFKPFYQVADRIIGSDFLEQVAEFFILFQSMYDGFIERGKSVSALLRSDVTSFLVVTSPEYLPMREAEFFLGALRERHLNLGALIVNRSLPYYLGDQNAIQIAQRLIADSEILVKDRFLGVDPRIMRGVLSEIGSTYLDFSNLYGQQHNLLATLLVDKAKVLATPYLETDVADLTSLERIGSNLDFVKF
ncbi:ArsA family ATPase [Acidithrix ferrooxidans]|uniref:Anion-transporting ATPase n=1 Tax=Acidithrix ferrooxidans TaxID=1280514 RepID=A0A0D8HCS0_9ACTN|nr:ArsA-related P-loop ATPase [Acidithrix ferrooxidans]KJF15689.1 anion-transporting ATPase [Acidithrix ferrooxidans]